MRVLTDMLPSELADELAPLGITASEARRIYAHQVQHGKRDWNVRDLARTKVERIRQRVEARTLEVTDRRTSAIDGFTKYLFRLHDGHLIEAVRIPLFDAKYTVCISSQA